MATVTTRTGTHVELIIGPDGAATPIACECRIGGTHTYMDWLHLPEHRTQLARAERVWATTSGTGRAATEDPGRHAPVDVARARPGQGEPEPE